MISQEKPVVSPSPPSGSPPRSRPLAQTLKNSVIRLTIRAGVAAHRRLLWPLDPLLLPLLASCAWLLARRERALALRHLQRHLGLAPDRAERTARALCRHLALALIEALSLLRSPRVLRGRVHFTPGSEERLRAALDAGRGAVFATGHIGNWEWMAAGLATSFRTASVVKGSYDPQLSDWIDAFRRAYGIETVRREDPDIADKLSELLKNGYLVGVLIDQNTKVASLAVPFFADPAPTPKGAASLARRHRVPLLVGSCQRIGLDHWIHVEGPLTPPADCPDPVYELTRQATAHLERAIRARPEQWVWFHPRWGEGRIID